MSLAERTVELGGKRAFWYTTADGVSPDSITGRIWAKAIDLSRGQGQETRRVAILSKVHKYGVFDAVGASRG